MDKRAIVPGSCWRCGVDDRRRAPPPDPVVVMIAAPHTSDWDFPLMLWLSWASGVEPHFLAKKEAVPRPDRTLHAQRRRGLTVDRSNPQGVVEDLVARAGTAEHFQLVIAVEGTRRARSRTGSRGSTGSPSRPTCRCAWASATARRRRVGYGPTIHPTGDVRADMDIIRAFYADKHGVNPDNAHRAAPARGGRGPPA